MRLRDEICGGLGALADPARRPVCAAAEGLHQRGDAGFEFARDAVVDVGDAVHGVGAAGIERIERRVARLFKRRDELAGAGVEAVGHVGVGLGDRLRDGLPLRAQRHHRAAAALLQYVRERLAVRPEIARELRARYGKARSDAVAVAADRLRRLDAAGDDALGDLAGAGGDGLARGMGGGFELDDDAEPLAADGFDRALGRIGEAAPDFVVAPADFVDEVLAARAQGFVDLVGFGDQLGRRGLGGLGEGAGDFVADAAQAPDAFGAHALDSLDELLGGRPERGLRDVADLADLARDLDADGFQPLRRALMSLGEGDARGVARDKNRLAMVDELGDERAQAPLVLAGGALQGGDLGADQGFQFDGAVEGALDAVSHRRHLAADRLGERGELLAGHGLGLCEPDGDMGDRGRRLAQVGQAPGERDEAEQQHRGRDRRQEEQHGFRTQEERRRRNIIGHALIAVIGAEREPDHGDDRGDEDRRAGRPLDLQRLDDEAGGGAVVVGGGRGRGEARLHAFAEALGGVARGLRLLGLGRGRGRLQRRGRRGRRRGWRPGGRAGGLGGGRASGRGLVLLLAEAQGVLDREHGLGYGIRSLVFLGHFVRLHFFGPRGRARVVRSFQGPLARARAKPALPRVALGPRGALRAG